MLALPRSPCLASLALPRSPRLSLQRLASALAFLARRACSLASATAPLATGGIAASDLPPSKSSVTHRRRSIEPPNSIFGWDGYSQFGLG